MYYCDVDATVESVQNCPTTHAFSLFVEIGAASEVVQTLKTWHDGNGYKTTVYVRSKYPEWGAGWQKLATAKSPEEYDLPLASGIVNNSPAKSVYFKDQFGVVTVSIHAHGETDIPNGTVISIIPDGYRPKYGLGVYSQGAFISFDANGNVVLYGDSGQSIPSGNWIAANVSFLACKA